MTVHTETPSHATASTESAQYVETDPSTRELLWKKNEGEDAILRVKSDEIIFILRGEESPGSGYLIYTLSETDENDKETFKLSIISSPQDLPATVLSKFLMDTDKLPDYLRSPYSLDVIVSTGSGTGKSVDFYERVLKELLRAVGLVEDSSNGYHVTTTTSPRTITDFAEQVQMQEQLQHELLQAQMQQQLLQAQLQQHLLQAHAARPQMMQRVLQELQAQGQHEVMTSLTPEQRQQMRQQPMVDGTNPHIQNAIQEHSQKIFHTCLPKFVDQFLGLQNIPTDAFDTFKKRCQVQARIDILSMLQNRGIQPQAEAQSYQSNALTHTTNKTVILLSGDGGVIDLLNGLDKSDTQPSLPPTLAIIPLGTGNALFHSLHKPLYTTTGGIPVPSTLVLSLRTLFRGITSPLPTFRVDFSPPGKLVSPVEAEKLLSSPQDDTHVNHLIGAIVASHGFHASLVYESDTPAYRVFGSKRFGMAAAELLKLSHGYRSLVEVRKRGKDEFEKLPREEYNYILATIVSNLEKGFTISPESKPLDGVLRLVTFGGMNGESTMGIMGGAYDGGSHVGMEGVGYEDVEEVRVKVLEGGERWRVVCVDGTIVRVEEGGVVSIKGEGGRERMRVVVDRGVAEGR